MTNDQLKRRQFSLRGVLSLMALLTLPLVAWTWAQIAGNPRSWLITVIAAFMTASGAAGAVLGWLAVGTKKGFTAGYLIGAPIGLALFYAILFWIGANL
jgi:hypothetical protein